VITGLVDYAPITATCFAVPQFLPQIRKLATTGDTAGVARHCQQLRKQLIVLAEDFLRAGGTILVRLTRSCAVCPFWERRPEHTQNGGNQGLFDHRLLVITSFSAAPLATAGPRCPPRPPEPPA